MNSYLEKDIRIKLLRFYNEPITEDDLKSITELGINNMTLSDKYKDIDLQEIAKCSNLRMLTLQYFQITDRELQILSDFKNLKMLQMVSCDINSKELYPFSELENLIISNSNFSNLPFSELPKNVTINGINRCVDLTSLHGLSNVENLYLTNIRRIMNFDILLNPNSLSYLNIDGSKIDNKKTLEELSKKIPVSHEDESLMIK